MLIETPYFLSVEQKVHSKNKSFSSRCIGLESRYVNKCKHSCKKHIFMFNQRFFRTNFRQSKVYPQCRFLQPKYRLYFISFRTPNWHHMCVSMKVIFHNNLKEEYYLKKKLIVIWVYLSYHRITEFCDSSEST